MSNHKIELFLKGEFTTIDVCLEGNEIPLREINDNEFYKLYSLFKINDDLNCHVRLKGWIQMDWEFIMKVDNKIKIKEKGTFDHKGFVTFTKSIIIQNV